MKTALFSLVILVLVCVATDALGGPLSASSDVEDAVAENFAHALQRVDVVLGVYEVPDGHVPTILPSGEILENVPGYSETMIRLGLCKLQSVQTMDGDSNSLVFVSQFPVRVERQLNVPFLPLPGSKWILALQKCTNDVSQMKKDKPVSASVAVIDQNMVRPFNDGLGAVCLNWPKDKGVDQPNHVMNVSESAVEDLRQLRKFYNAQKSKNAWSETDMNLVRKSLKSDFGKSVLHKLSQSGPATLKESQGHEIP